jgi:iron-sulfur cluster insertion protein
MIKVTEAAKTRMIDVLIDEKASLLRFGLHGGGCNGFQYFLSIEKEKVEDDTEVFLGDGYTILVDPASMMYLAEVEIDFKRDLMGENFVFNNPNVSNSCGCGSSISF